MTYEDYVNYVCDRISAQSEKVIFNNAWLLPDNKSQFDFVPDEIKNVMRQAAIASGTGAIPIDPQFVRGMLASEASDELYEELMTLLVEQPLIIMETPVQAKEFSEMKIPMVLLYNTKDVSVPPGAFLGMFKAWGDNPVVEVDCDHEGLFTAPEVYTEGLIKAINL